MKQALSEKISPPAFLDYVARVPELPEVEVLTRHLAPLLRGRKINDLEVRRPKSLLPSTLKDFRRKLRGARFIDVSRRGKYLLFTLAPANGGKDLTLVGHLGMTGRMYLMPKDAVLPKHVVAVFKLGAEDFIFEDTRYFGRLTLDNTPVSQLGPEPLSDDFSAEDFCRELQRFTQSIKVKLLDQSLVAGVGNIYASEALFRAKIPPQLAARRLRPTQAKSLLDAIRETLTEAINLGSTVPLNYSGNGERDGLFYYGSAPDAPDLYEERLRVYDRAGQPCITCGNAIKRIVQAARSTFYCPHCQASAKGVSRKTAKNP